MLLRFVMVGVVACLGLEVPDLPAAAPGEPSRCVWCEGPRAETPPAPAVEETPMPAGLDAFATAADEPADPDAAFLGAMTATLQQFEAELAAVQAAAAVEQLAAAPPAPTSAPEPVVEQPADEDLYPGLAYALNRQAEGLASVESVAPAPGAAEAAPSEPLAAAASRGERFQTAVRLTGQALHAWLSVLQTPALACDAAEVTLSR
jgi:hypothetical protein